MMTTVPLFAFLEVEYLEYPKELQKLHNDCPLAAEKLEIKKKMLSDQNLKTADYNICIGSVGKLVHKLFHKEKYLLYQENLQLYLRLELTITS